MPDASTLSMIQPVFALAGLSLVMAFAQGATRLPAMRRAGLRLQDAAHTADLGPRLPPAARRVNDNYNHLMEAPTVFYAVALGIGIAGLADPTHVACAWAYVALRALHSLVQATINRVALRAALYTASWGALGAMVVRVLAPY